MTESDRNVDPVPESTPQSRPDPQHVTQLLQSIERGEGAATDELLVAVYDELRALARSRLRQEPAGHTLQPTALVHEAYLRLVGSREDGQGPAWDHRGHFFGAAAIAMRRILVERARRYQRQKHGGGRQRVELEDAPVAEVEASVDLVALDEALVRLAEHDPRMAQVVDLRFFAGLDGAETARILGVSERTVKREWSFARAWLHRAMDGDLPS